MRQPENSRLPDSASVPPTGPRPTRRRLLALGGAAALQLALTGTAARAATAAPEPTRQPARRRQAVTLRFLGLSGPPFEQLQGRLFDIYRQRNPNVTIEQERVPFPELYRKITTAFASGDPPDIIYADGPLVAGYAYNKVIYPLEEFYTADELDDMAPATRAEASFRGTFYAPQERQSAIALAYNVDLVRPLGIEPPRTLDAAWKWPDTVEVFMRATQRASADAPPDVWGLVFQTIGNYYTAGTLMRSNSERDSNTWRGISPDGKTVRGYIDTPEAVEALQFYQDLFVKHKVTPQAPVPDAFENGKAAFYLGPITPYTNIKLRNLPVNFGVTPIPHFKTPISHTGSFHFAVTEASKNKVEAAALAKFMTGKEAQLTIFREVPVIPNLKSVYAELPAFSEYPLKVYFDTLFQWGEMRPQTPANLEYTTAMDEALRNIVAGGNPADELRTAVGKINSALARLT